VPDEEWDNGFTLSGSNDNLNWTVLKTVVAPASNEVVESPWLFLRVEGVGTSFGDPRNALVTVEYLDAEEATLALDTGEVTITNTPLEVTGEVTAATPSDALVRETHQISLLKEILAELKKQTMLLEEMHS
jgi:hypothetical protein